MGEIASSQNEQPRRKKLSTKVDLTPMVDLGFLLITFFVFTTSLTKPTAINLIVPAEGPPTQTAASKTLNLILAADNKIHYYMGNDVRNQGCTNFSPEGVRAVILLKRRQIENQFGSKEDMVILIRPTKDASYMNLVDILDELLITGIKKYALMDEDDRQTQWGSNLMNPC